MNNLLLDIMAVVSYGLFGLGIRYFVDRLADIRTRISGCLGGALLSTTYGICVAYVHDHTPDFTIRAFFYTVFMLFYLFSNPKGLAELILSSERQLAVIRFILGLIFILLFAIFGIGLQRTLLMPR